MTMKQLSSMVSLTLFCSLLAPLLFPCECYQSQSHDIQIDALTTSNTFSRPGSKRIHVGHGVKSIDINIDTSSRATDLKYVVDRQRRRQRQTHTHKQQRQRQRQRQQILYGHSFARNGDIETDTVSDIPVPNSAATVDLPSFPTWRQSQRRYNYLFNVRGGGDKNDDDRGGSGGAEVGTLPADSASSGKEQSESNGSNSKQSVAEDTNLPKPSPPSLEPQSKSKASESNNINNINIHNDNESTVTSTVITKGETNNNNKVTIKRKRDTGPATPSSAATTTAVAQVKAKAVATFDKSKQKTTAFKKQLSTSIPKFAKDFNKRLHQASATFKQRTVHHTKTTIHDLQQLQVTTKQSLKSYMESMKTQKNKLLLGLGKQNSPTSTFDAGSDNGGDDYDHDDSHRIIMTAAQAHAKNALGIARDKWKNASIIASQILLGTGMTLRQDITIWSIVFIISLLGTSLGFQSYLYFVTVGLSVSIGLNALSTLIVFNALSTKSIPLLSNLHTTLVFLWSVRLTSFLLHREYINWKEWHTKLKETDDRFRLSTKNNKIPIWLTCSTCYSCMIMPCIYRLKASTILSGEATQHQRRSNWGVVGKTGIAFQSIGLLLETIADIQKAKFKRKDGNRHLWCNVGLWSFSTYPNYLGEVMFWVGTYVGGISCCSTIMQHCLCSIGLVFILMVMKMNIDSLSSQHMRKWGRNDEWLEFRRTHSILGPIRVSTTNEEVLPIYR